MAKPQPTTWQEIQVEAERIRVAVPRLLRREACRAYVTAPQLFDIMEAAGWIKPAVAGNRMTLFDRHALDACIDRLVAGEFPEVKPASSRSAASASSVSSLA